MMIKHGQVRNDRNTQEPNALETLANWEAPAPVQKVFHLHLYDRRTDNVWPPLFGQAAACAKSWISWPFATRRPPANSWGSRWPVSSLRAASCRCPPLPCQQNVRMFWLEHRVHIIFKRVWKTNAGNSRSNFCPRLQLSLQDCTSHHHNRLPCASKNGYVRAWIVPCSLPFCLAFFTFYVWVWGSYLEGKTSLHQCLDGGGFSQHGICTGFQRYG